MRRGKRALHERRWETSGAAVGIEAGGAIAAVWLLLENSYPTAIYKVVAFEITPGVHWLSLVLVAAVLAIAALVVSRGAPGGRLRMLSKAWSPLLLNLLIVARALAGIEPLYLEPLILSVSVGAALGLSVYMALGVRAQGPPVQGRVWLVAILAVAALAGWWFYDVQDGMLDGRAYGWRDGGLYYARVKNTAQAEGFLQETPAREPFYDHFGPGLAALVPAWFLWRSYRIVMAAQAAALALLGPAVYLYARGRGARGPAAFLLGAGALFHPSVSQLAYSFSYGFHPITLAMPLVVVSIHFWEKRRWWLFAAAALAAVSMEETVLPLYVGLGAVSFMWDMRGGWSLRRRWAGAVLGGVSVALFLVITKLIMPAVAGQEYFQMAKYAHLGEGFLDVLASPVLEAQAFWGLLLAKRSIVFTALLVGSAAFLPLFAPRQLLYAVVVFVFVMLLENENVKNISFWYQSLVVAAWLAAAAAGAVRLGSERRLGAAAAMAACALVLCHFHGLMPFSRITMAFQRPASAQARAATAELMRIAEGTPRDARVLATMREAMLFADARVRPVDEWDGLADADLAVLDPRSAWGQDPARTREAFEALISSGAYVIEPVEGVWVLVRRDADR